MDTNTTPTQVIDVVVLPHVAFAYLRTIKVTEKMDRCFLTEHKGVFYMDLVGKGRNISEARKDLAKKVRDNIKRLEANEDRRISQDRRLAFLKTVVV
jgi:hypothetical protein